MATISTVKISNMALSRVGTGTRIESLTENSREAKECSLWYDFARLATLEAYPWNFASIRKTLAASSEDPPTDWVYKYQYPADVIKIQEIENTYNDLSEDAVAFKVRLADTGETQVVLTDQPTAIAICTFDQELVDLYTPQFVTALSYRLAAAIAPGLTGKASLAEALMEKFEFEIMKASAYDGNEQVERPERDSPSIRGRN